MAAGSDPKQNTPSLLERWRALAPAAPPSAPPRSRPPPPAPSPDVADVREPTAADPAALLTAIEEAIAAVPPGNRPALKGAALKSLEPVRIALGLAPAARDSAALVLAFEQIEDLFEALLLAPEPGPAPEE